MFRSKLLKMATGAVMSGAVMLSLAQRRSSRLGLELQRWLIGWFVWRFFRQ